MGDGNYDSGNVWDNFLLDVKEADRLKSLSNDRVIKDLKGGLRVKNIDSKIYEFGSRILGGANSNSDLDLYVDIGKYIPINKKECSEILFDFFKYYSTFNFSQVAVCCYIGMEKTLEERRFCLPDRFQKTLSYEAADVMIYDFIKVNINKAAFINELQLNDLQTKMVQQLQSTIF